VPAEFIPVIIIVIAVVGWFFWQEEKKRRQRLADWAARNGWLFSEGNGVT
jgi:nicotinamide riboside transporter PnuC